MASYFAAIFTDLERHSEVWTRIPRDRMVAIIAEYRYLAESMAAQYRVAVDNGATAASVDGFQGGRHCPMLPLLRCPFLAKSCRGRGRWKPNRAHMIYTP